MDAHHEVGAEGSLRHLRAQWRKDKALLEQQNQLLKMNVLELRERTLSLQRSNTALVHSIDNARSANTTKSTIQIHRLQQENFKLKEQLMHTSMERDRSLSKTQKLKEEQSRLKERNSSLTKEKNLAQLKFEKQLSFLNKEFQRLRTSNDRLLESFQSVISNVNIAAINSSTNCYFNTSASSQKGLGKTLMTSGRISNRTSRRIQLESCTHCKDYTSGNKENSANSSAVLICAKCIEEKSSVDGPSIVGIEKQFSQRSQRAGMGESGQHVGQAKPLVPNLQINMLSVLKEKPTNLGESSGQRIDYSLARREQVKTIPYMEEWGLPSRTACEGGMQGMPTDSSRGNRTSRRVSSHRTNPNSLLTNKAAATSSRVSCKTNASNALRAELRDSIFEQQRRKATGEALNISKQCSKPNLLTEGSVLQRGSEGIGSVVEAHNYTVAGFKHKRKSTLAHSTQLLMRLQTATAEETEDCRGITWRVDPNESEACPLSRPLAAESVTSVRDSELEERESGLANRECDKRLSGFAPTDLPSEESGRTKLRISVGKDVRTSGLASRPFTKSASLKTSLVAPEVLFGSDYPYGKLTNNPVGFARGSVQGGSVWSNLASARHKTHNSLSQASAGELVGSEGTWNPIQERRTESSVGLEYRSGVGESKEQEEQAELNGEEPDTPNQSESNPLRGSREEWGRKRRSAEVRESVEDCVTFNLMLREKLASIEDRIRQSRSGHLATVAPSLPTSVCSSRHFARS